MTRPFGFLATTSIALTAFASIARVQGIMVGINKNWQSTPNLQNIACVPNASISPNPSYRVCNAGYEWNGLKRACLKIK